ncbi:MAG TPA: T9SS type A sorting domain-containing protein [Bacteroidales bacterium]|nr:T9SS type A sorting domain-containing protein [Bacteroidales bacterium]
MKTIRSLLFLLLFSFEGNCQIIDTNNSWNYLEVLVPTCKKSTNCEGKLYQNFNCRIGGDTLINGKVYNKVIETTKRNNDSSSESYISGFLREEENHKKIFSLLSYLDDSTEVLLYDFTIKKDSVFNSTYERIYHLPEGDKIIKDTLYSSQVIDIDSVVYMGIKRLRIKFLDFRVNWIEDNPEKDTVEWIEGIGSNKGLLNYAYGDYNLLCFKQNDEVKYYNKLGLDCNYSGPINKLEDNEFNKIRLYPNPLRGKILYISSESIIKTVLIYNVCGYLVGQFTPENTDYQIPLYNLNSGIYIFQIDGFPFKIII